MKWSEIAIGTIAFTAEIVFYRYLFGQKVEGNAFVVFGVMDGEKKTSIPASLQRVQIMKGAGTAELTREMITKTFPNIEQLVGRSIYVSVSLLTESAGRFWNVAGQRHHSLEAMAYAVLALVKAKDFNKAGEAVHWLGRQQSHYGGSGTTQATIMVFQALAEYRTQVKDQQNFNLDVELAVAGRSRPVRFNINRRNVHITRSDKVEINEDFNVTARGTGSATLSVLTLYYARSVEKKSDCRLFDLTVKMEKDSESKIDKETFLYKRDETDATMTILDIGIPTGFDVEENDLKELSSGKERYIQKYAKNTGLSGRGSLILYLNKVSHKEIERLVFRMNKMVDVGLLQPAPVTIYEYYSPDARCTKFYHPERSDGALYRLCKGDVCQCAEGIITQIIV
ncbi:complement C3-like [Chanodichthys erythropterus]|uniref:complement C3-like n=1 Tax=Chanodichthys erythropterus TaxID=933992 RepID=UPI00351E180C